MHVAFAVFAIDAVQDLSVRYRTQGGDGQNLSLATGEETGTMYSWNNANFSSQWTDIVDATAVNTFAFVQQPAAYNEFLQFVDTFVDFAFLLWVLLVELRALLCHRCREHI